MSGVTWNIDPAQYFHDLTLARVEAIEADIVQLVDGLTDEARAFMQSEARWTDRTGAARAGLYADVEHAVRQSVYLLLSHDVTLDYVWWLEFAYQGRFEILSTTSDAFWPRLYNGVVEILRRHSS